MIDITFKFPDWLGKVQRAMPEVRLFIAANMQTNRGLLFDAEGSRNGHLKWESLKFRSGQILSNRGTLRKSMSPTPALGRPGRDGVVRFSGDRITIGTKLAFAAMMNWGTTQLPGGVLRPVKAKALRIPLPGGKKATDLAKNLAKEEGTKSKKSQGTGSENVIFRKSVRIPMRRFDEWMPDDQKELNVALRNKLKEVIQR